MIKLKKLFVIFLSAVIVSLPTLSMADETPVQNLVAGQSDIAESNEDLGGKKNDMFELPLCLQMLWKNLKYKLLNHLHL